MSLPGETGIVRKDTKSPRQEELVKLRIAINGRKEAEGW